VVDKIEVARALSRALAVDLLTRIRKGAEHLKEPPVLAVVRSSGDAAASYAASREKSAREAGIRVVSREFPEGGGADAAGRFLRELSADPGIDAVLVETPLAAGIDESKLRSALDPAKDAEGLSPANYGRLFSARSWAEVEEGAFPAPPTALSIAALARACGVGIKGLSALVVGRSNSVGKPAARLLSLLDATVTLAHSKTRDLPLLCSRAELLVACVGRPECIEAAWVKKGAVVIDAGVHAAGARLVGDVQASAADRAAFMTPVPGGVGPLTTAYLLNNVLRLARGRDRSAA
jgi:methylenetetrahydrofolate dehydrogenase (NADP+)/methenyltetrahydrofolate cyclohydrolase